MRQTRIRAVGLVALCTLLLAGCGGGSGGDACDGWTCSDHGQCVLTDGEPGCDCDAFYEPSEDGTECISVVQDPCQPYDCAGHGTCRVTAQDEPYCECDTGWFPTGDGLSCIENQCQGDCGDMGCCGQRCCLPLPTNADVIGGLVDNGLARSAPGSFDTDSDCAAGSALGDCELVAVPGGVDVCVCRLDSLTVSGGLRVTGAAALAVLAYGTISVNGTIDLAARGDAGGPGALSQTDAEAAILAGRQGRPPTGPWAAARAIRPVPRASIRSSAARKARTAAAARPVAAEVERCSWWPVGASPLARPSAPVVEAGPVASTIRTGPASAGPAGAAAVRCCSKRRR